jgi:hypothetical protein
MGRTLFSLRFIFINAGVLVYFLWLQPGFLRALQEASVRPNWGLGAGLMALQILNLLAMLYKGTFTQQRIASLHPSADEPSRGFSIAAMLAIGLVILCYLGLVSPLVNWAILGLLGIDIRGEPPFWQGLFGFLYLFAMLVLNAWLPIVSVFPSIETIKLPDWLKIGEAYPMATEWSADFILAAFGVSAYTLVWEQLALNTPINATTPQSTLLEYFGAVVFFCMVYPATNVLATAEDWLAMRPRWSRWLSGLVFTVILLIAISNIPRAR